MVPILVSHGLFLCWLVVMLIAFGQAVERIERHAPRKRKLRRQAAAGLIAVLLLLVLFWVSLLAVNHWFGVRIYGVTYLFILLALVITLPLTVLIETFSAKLHANLGSNWPRWLEYPYVIIGLLGIYKALVDLKYPATDWMAVISAPLLIITAAAIKITKTNIEVGLSSILRRHMIKASRWRRRKTLENAALWNEARSHEVTPERLALIQSLITDVVAIDKELWVDLRQSSRLIFFFNFIAIPAGLIGAVVGLIAAGWLYSLIALFAIPISLHILFRVLLSYTEFSIPREAMEKLSAILDAKPLNRGEALVFLDKLNALKLKELNASNIDQDIRRRVERSESSLINPDLRTAT